MKKTSLPSVPVCQPMTLRVSPSPEPTYQPVKAETASTSPATQVIGRPTAQSRRCGRVASGAPCGRDGRRGGAPALHARSMGKAGFARIRARASGGGVGGRSTDGAGRPTGGDAVASTRRATGRRASSVQRLRLRRSSIGRAAECPMCGGEAWERGPWRPRAATRRARGAAGRPDVAEAPQRPKSRSTWFQIDDESAASAASRSRT